VVARSVGLPRRLVAAFILHRLRGRPLLMPAAEIGTVRTVAATTAMTPAPAMSEAVLTAVALLIAIRPGILLLRLSTAGNECGQTADLLSTFMSALAWLLLAWLLLVWLRLMLRAIVYLLVARRKWLCIAGQIRLLLRFTRTVAWFVLAHERLGVVVVAIKALVGSLLLAARRALLWLLIVVRVLLAELLLRCGDKAEIMFGMLVVILGGHRIAGSLRVTRKLDIFFRDMRSGAADFDVGTV
jgi:hypothetical protein